MEFRPSAWKGSKSYRFVVKRTPISHKDDKQSYLDDGCPLVP